MQKVWLLVQLSYIERANGVCHSPNYMILKLCQLFVRDKEMIKKPEYIMLRIPKELKEKYEIVLNEAKTYYKKEGMLPTVEQISDRTSLTECEIRKTIEEIIGIYDKQRHMDY